MQLISHAIAFEQGQSIWQTEFYYLGDMSEASRQNIVDFAVAWDILLTPKLMLAISADTQKVGSITKRVLPKIGISYVRAAPAVGLHPGNSIPAINAAVITHRGAPGFSPKGISRNYISGIPQTLTDGGRLQATYPVIIADFINTLKLNFIVAPNNWTFVSQQGLDIPITIVKSTVRPQTAIIRSRLPDTPIL